MLLEVAKEGGPSTTRKTVWGQHPLPAKSTPSREMGAAQSWTNSSSRPWTNGQVGCDDREAGSPEIPVH